MAEYKIGQYRKTLELIQWVFIIDNNLIFISLWSTQHLLMKIVHFGRKSYVQF